MYIYIYIYINDIFFFILNGPQTVMIMSRPLYSS